MKKRDKKNNILNCPACGGVVAKGIEGWIEMETRCPHCGQNIKITTKTEVEIN